MTVLVFFIASIVFELLQYALRSSNVPIDEICGEFGELSVVEMNVDTNDRHAEAKKTETRERREVGTRSGAFEVNST